MTKGAPGFDSERQTKADPTPDTPVLTLDDFTDYVAFHIKCDQIEHRSESAPVKMSQKKCRFCD